MRILLWLLVLAALAAGLSLAALHNDGYALLVLPPWRIELSLNLLLLLALAGFLVVHLTMRAISALVGMPASVREYRARRARENAEAALCDAVSLSFEGRFGRALRRAEAAFNAAYVPLLAALIAARAAHGMRDEQRLTYWRDQARQQDKGVSVARLMVEAGIAIDRRDYENAHELLDQLSRTGGRHVAAQRLALRVHQGLGQWQEVERVVRQLGKHHAMTPEQATPLLRRAQRERVAQLRGNAAALERYLGGLADADRFDPGFVLNAVPALIATDNNAEAARLIEDALDTQWDSALAGAYGECSGGDVLGRISHAERWLHVHPRDAKLLLTLGRLCRRQQLWGKAQSYLEASLSIQPTRWAHLELAALFDHLGHTAEANAHYRTAAGEFD